MEDEHQIVPSASQMAVLGITRTTMKRLRSQKKPAELIALYAFYADVAAWQGTQSIRSTDPFVAKGLQWSISKVHRVKERLKSLGLIEPVIRRDEKSGRITKHYIRVRYLVRSGMQNFVDPPECHFSTSGDLNPNCFGIKEELRSIKTTSIFRCRENRPGCFADVLEFVCSEIEPKVDAAEVDRLLALHDGDQPPRKLSDRLHAEGNDFLAEKVQLAAIWWKRSEDNGWILTDWKSALKGFAAKSGDEFGGLGITTKRWRPRE